MVEKVTNNTEKLCQTIDNIIKGIIKCYLQEMIFAFQEYKCKKGAIK